MKQWIRRCYLFLRRHVPIVFRESWSYISSTGNRFVTVFYLFLLTLVFPSYALHFRSLLFAWLSLIPLGLFGVMWYFHGLIEQED